MEEIVQIHTLTEMFLNVWSICYRS